ncbi:MAG: AMP-binding protein [Rhodoblastus sp.]
MLLQQLQTHAVETPNKPFLVLWQQDSYRVLSFSQFHEMSMSLAHFLTERLGDAKGKVVFIVLQKFPLLHPMMIATMYAGAVPSYLPFLTPKQDPDIYYSQHKALFELIRSALRQAAKSASDIRCNAPRRRFPTQCANAVGSIWCALATSKMWRDPATLEQSATT